MSKDGKVTTSVSNASDGAIAAFQGGDEQRSEELRDFLMGEQGQPGGRHDLSPRGWTSDDQQLRERQVIESDPAEQPARQEEPTFVQHQPQFQPQAQPQQEEDGQDFRKLYGESENQKGELRRALQALKEQNDMLAAMVQNQQPQQQQYAPQPQYQHTAAQPQPQYQQLQFDPNQIPRLIDKEDGEFIEAGEMDRVLREKVAPYLFGALNEARTARAELGNFVQRQAQEALAHRGITPVVQQQLLMKHPYINSIADPYQRIQALISAAESEKAMALMQRAQPQPIQQQQPQAGAAGVARRVTYIEPSSGSASPAQGVGQSRAQAFQQEWANTMALPVEGGARGTAQKQILEKYGMRSYTGYRDPSVLTR